MWYKFLTCLCLIGCTKEDIPFFGPPEEYVLLGAADTLDPQDITLFDMGLSYLGYHQKIIDLNINQELFDTYVDDTSTFLYYSGHGETYPRLVMNDSFLYFEKQIFNATYVFISACYVLQSATKIRRLMGANTQVLMGYTKKAKDKEDSWIAYHMIERMMYGDNIPTAFFEAHKDHAYWHDRWVMYVRNNDEIIEYSERSGNRIYP